MPTDALRDSSAVWLGCASLVVGLVFALTILIVKYVVERDVF